MCGSQISIEILVHLVHSVLGVIPSVPSHLRVRPLRHHLHDLYGKPCNTKLPPPCASHICTVPVGDLTDFD